MVKSLVFRELHAAPKNQKVKRQYITAETLTYPTDIPHHIRASYIYHIRPTIATMSEPATSTASDHRNHAPTAVLRSSGSM